MSLLSVLIPTNSTKSWFETVLSEGICPLAHESEASWFPYLFLSKSWRKTNCWNVYTARIGPCCVLGSSLPRLRDKRFCEFFVGRATTMNRIDMSFEVRLSVNRLSISSVLDRAVTFKIWSEVLLQSWWTLFNIHHYYNCCMLLIKVILIDRY